MLPSSAQQSGEKLRSWLSAPVPLHRPHRNVQWVPRLDPQNSGNGEGGGGTLSELFCYNSFCMSEPGRDGTKLPGSPLLGTIDNLHLLHGEFPESMGTQCLPNPFTTLSCIQVHSLPKKTGSLEALLTSSVPHRPLGSHPGSWRGLKCSGCIHTLRLLLGCIEQCRECQRQSTRQKLISGDISPDSGAALAISSNSVAPSIKAYCPLMGNLQTEFDFFIKNQQAADEKESPGSSHLPLLAQA